jgi:cell division transport system permease protein
MNFIIFKRHLIRAWSRHWALQLASITVMSLVLIILNFLFLGFTAFHQTLLQWGNGMEMIVYLKGDVDAVQADQLREKIHRSGDFSKVEFVSKGDATKKFLTSLGSDSLALMDDPKWSSPIPASFELHLSDQVPLAKRLPAMQTWSSELKTLGFVEDVFYGQGWIENFSRFLQSVRGLVAVLWILSLSVGLLIVSNCIRLSFMQRYDEIAILELVGATSTFIRLPFIFEGFVLGAMASMISLGISYGIHSMALVWLSQNWSFWGAFNLLSPLATWHIAANIATGMAFGMLGSWNCMRKLNSGWAAVK